MTEPTMAELSRRLDEVAHRLDEVAAAVAKIPSAELLTALRERLSDRVDVVRADTTRVMAGLDALARGLDTEREARATADMHEAEARQKAIQAEAEALQQQIQTQRAESRGWFKWAFSGVVSAFGLWVANILGWRPG